jgi:hypothetical protein
MLRDRHGLRMNTYGREPPSLNNVAGLCRLSSPVSDLMRYR